MSELCSTRNITAVLAAAAALAVSLGGPSGESDRYGERVVGLPVPDLSAPDFSPFIITNAEAADSRKFKVTGVVLGLAGEGSLNINQDTDGVEAKGKTKVLLSNDFKTEYHNNYKECDGTHRRDFIIGKAYSSSGKEIRLTKRNVPKGARVIVKGHLRKSAHLCVPIQYYENDRPVYDNLYVLGKH